MADPDSKRCTNCGETKPISEFHKKSATKDGLRGHCKICHCARSSARYAKDPKAVLAVNAAWRVANPVKVRQLHAEYYENNKARVSQLTKQWRALNPERRRETERIGAARRRAVNPLPSREAAKRHRENHIEKVRARERTYQTNNPAKVRLANAKWRKLNPAKARAAERAWNLANPDKRAAFKANRRARQRGAVGEHTAAQVAALYLLQKGRCAHCTAKLGKRFHRDHITPLIRGGSNDIGNIQLLCQKCNCSKGPKDPIEHARELGRLF